MLAVMGDLLEDVVVVLEGPPQLGTDMAATIRRATGGSAANVARTAAQLAAAAGPQRSATSPPGPPAVRFVGRVGDDPLGAQLVAALAADGIDTRVERAGRTGSVVVLVEPGGERTMLPDRASALELDLGDEQATQLVEDVEWLHLTSYSFVVEPVATSARRLAAAARRHGAGVSLDASSTAIIERHGRPAFATMIAELAPDVLFANEVEAQLLPADPGAGLYVVKRGSAPASYRLADGTHAAVPAEPLSHVTDSTGAGDAFAAGFLLAWIDCSDPEAACAAGHRAAADVLRTGRRGSFPTT